MTIEDKQVIPVVFGIDDKFVPFLSVAVKSILDNASKDYYYKFYVFNTGFRRDYAKELSVYVTENSTIELVNVSSYMDSVKESVCIRNQYTDAIYYRFFIPEILSQYDKVIYLDADVIVKGDLSMLYNVDLEDNLLGAVNDEVVLNSQLFIDYVEKYLGVSHKRYFNSGMLLINVKKFLEEKIGRKFIKMASKIKFEVAPDQDYLNTLCKNRVKLIDCTWNKMPIPKDGITENEINIIHFNLNSKPWQYDDVMYASYFWDYAKRTEHYACILKLKGEFGMEEQKKAIAHGENLISLAEQCIKRCSNVPEKIEEIVNAL